MDLNLEQYVKQANNGNRQALELVVSRIQEKIYGLALRMMRNPEDAEDEAQEILIKVITHMSDFREESTFSSWVYRVACNHLLTKRKRKSERERMTFDFVEEFISAQDENTNPLTVSGPERDVLQEEARFVCMQSVLACLEKELRIAFILGDLYEVTSKEGAFILGITPVTFRKRLSRSRTHLQNFMLKHCGIVNKNNTCRCDKNAARRLKQCLATPGKKTFIIKEVAAKNRDDAVAHWKELSEIHRTVAMFRRYPEYQSPDSFTNIVRDLVDSGKYKFFNNTPCREIL